MRKLATAAFSFAVGIFLAQYFITDMLWRLAAACLLAVFAAGAFFLKKSWRTRTMLIIFAMSVALFYCVAYEYLLLRPVKCYDGAVEMVELEAVESPEATAFGARVTVKVKAPRLLGVKAVYYGGEELLSLKPGNRVITQVEFSCEIKSTFAAEGTFFCLYDRGEAVIQEGKAASIRYLPQRFFKVFVDKVNVLYRDDVSAFMSSILMGETDDLPARDRAALSEAGLWHVTAVSGLHCSFLISLLGFFLGRGRERAKAFLGIALLIFYAFSVGGSPSVVRAAIMIGFVLLAPLFGRESDPLTDLSAALAVILAANPFAAASVSLQLSFGAVLGLLLVTPVISAALMKKGKGGIFRFIVSSVSATLGALIFTVPLCAVYFNVFTLVTPISNLLCLWAVALAFSLGMLSVALGFLLLPLGKILAWGGSVLARYVLFLAEGLAAIPYHAVYFTNPHLKYWLVYAYVLFVLCFLVKKNRARRAAVAALLVSCALVFCLFLARKETAAPPLTVTVLDVGQGQCVLLTSGDEAVVVDCGSLETGLDTGEIAAEELFGRGFYTVRAMVVTNPDEDHINGISTLCARAAVEEIFIPVIKDEFDAAKTLAEAAGDTPFHVTAGETMTFGKAQLTVYSPLSGDGGNDGGLAVLCSAGDFDVLIMGDMSERAEEALLDLMPKTDIEVLLAGHHGSNDACGERILHETAPEAVIVSVGENIFGHPGREALIRIKEADCALYRTDRQGTVSIKGN